jgi:hypothetical protein
LQSSVVSPASSKINAKSVTKDGKFCKQHHSSQTLFSNYTTKYNISIAENYEYNVNIHPKTCDISEFFAARRRQCKKTAIFFDYFAHNPHNPA